MQRNPLPGIRQQRSQAIAHFPGRLARKGNGEALRRKPRRDGQSSGRCDGSRFGFFQIPDPPRQAAARRRFRRRGVDRRPARPRGRHRLPLAARGSAAACRTDDAPPRVARPQAKATAGLAASARLALETARRLGCAGAVRHPRTGEWCRTRRRSRPVESPLVCANGKPLRRPATTRPARCLPAAENRAAAVPAPAAPAVLRSVGRRFCFSPPPDGFRKGFQAGERGCAWNRPLPAAPVLRSGPRDRPPDAITPTVNGLPQAGHSPS